MDKGSTVVILNTTEYITKMYNILDNKNKFYKPDSNLNCNKYIYEKSPRYKKESFTTIKECKTNSK